MMSAKQLLRQPWTVIGPRQIEEDGVTYWEIRVAELPEFFVAAESRDEVLDEYLDALESFLDCFLENGETPPSPDAGSWHLRLLAHPGNQNTLNPEGVSELTATPAATASLAVPAI